MAVLHYRFNLVQAAKADWQFSGILARTSSRLVGVTELQKVCARLFIFSK